MPVYPVISVQQPWAWAIVNGFKPIENRSWPTRFRGPLLVHAGKKYDEGAFDFIMDIINSNPMLAGALNAKGGITEYKIKQHRGGIVGVTYITDCVAESNSPWFIGEHGFVLRGSRPLTFHPCKGQLNIFNLDFPYEIQEFKKL